MTASCCTENFRICRNGINPEKAEGTTLRRTAANGARSGTELEGEAGEAVFLQKQ